MTRSILLVLVVLAVTLAPRGAVGQEGSDTVATVDRPFVTGGAFDKPYLTSLLGRTAIGGYAETHARWRQVDGARDEMGFELKRWNIFTATQVSDFVRIGAEIEFEELGEAITIEFATVDFLIHPSFTLRAGAILAPLGRFNLSHDSPRNEFTDRPLVSTEVIGTALTELGLGALGVVSLPAGGRVTYELYAVNGFHDGLITDSPDGTRIPAGKKNLVDNNDSPAVVGRLAFSPRLGYELAVSAHRGAYNTFALDGEQIDARHDLTIWAVDLEAEIAGIAVSGEAVIADLEIPQSLEAIYAARQRGLYLQAIRTFGRGWIPTLPQSSFGVGTRYDWVDFDAEFTGDSVRRATVGLHFRPTEDTIVKLDYLRGRTRDRFNNPGDEAGVLFSIATYF